MSRGQGTSLRLDASTLVTSNVTVVDPPSSALDRLVSAALARKDLTALRDMLRVVAEAMGCYGCALWQVQPLAGADRGTQQVLTPDSKIFVLTAGVPDDIVCAFHDVPVNSATGYAMQNGRIKVRDVSAEPLVGRGSGRFLQRAEIRSLCSIRLDLDESTPGALTLYKQQIHDFTDAEFGTLQQLATHIPALYHAVRDRVSFRVLERVSFYLAGGESDRNATVHRIMDDVCEAVQDGLQCLECSLYLEPVGRPAGTLELFASTRRSFLRRDTLTRGCSGLTCWVWNAGEPLAIFDLKNFRDEQVAGLLWHDEVDVGAQTRSLLGLSDQDELPPISFLAVPVVAENSTVGVLRCCAARKGPYLFAERERELLAMVSSRIAQYWIQYRAREELSIELRSWTTFIHSVSRLNQAIQGSLTGQANQDQSLFEQALSLLLEIIPTVTIAEISLFDAEKRAVSVAAIQARDWRPGSEAEAIARKRLSARVDQDPPRSPASVVYRRRRPLQVRATKGQYTPAFPEIRRSIFAPILADGQFLGMLSVHTDIDFPFSKQFESMIELLAQQIGLFLRLSLGLRQLRQASQDLYHQLRNPIFQAVKRCSVVRGCEYDKNFEAVRGLVKKSQRVVANLRLYDCLSSGNPIDVKTEPVLLNDLVKPLIEAADDNQILWRSRGITFKVDRGTFDLHASLRLDTALFEQAVNNVLDNAGKYSFKDTQVVISARSAGAGYVEIVVSNEGIPITAEQGQLATRRGWQSEQVKGLAGEGSGIGLWIVDNIMTGHEGRLVLVPTREDGKTEVCLVFARVDGGAHG